MVGLTLMVSTCSTSVKVPNTMTTAPVTIAMIGTCSSPHRRDHRRHDRHHERAVATNRWYLALATKNTSSLIEFGRGA
jgi:hypothetical protein